MSSASDGGARHPRVIALANQKGGVGKTTTTINLGACLAELGFRTLIVDLDPQANASSGLDVDVRGLDVTIYHVLLGEASLIDCIEATAVKNLFVAPSSLDLAGAELELAAAIGRENRLKRALAGVVDDYDFVLIDCPPSLGLLSVNGLTAANEIMVPVQCEYFALEGLGQLLRNVNLVRDQLNPSLDLRYIVCTMYARSKLADQVVAALRQSPELGHLVCKNVIPRQVKLSEAPSFGQPITTFESSGRGASAYRSLAQEVVNG